MKKVTALLATLALTFSMVACGSGEDVKSAVSYMSDKYDLTAICICREQWGVDAYTLWGGYYSGGYYPSRNNMLCPAQSPEAGCRTPVFRMLGIDPIYGFDEGKYNVKLSGCPTMENSRSSGLSLMLSFSPSAYP